MRITLAERKPRRSDDPMTRRLVIDNHYTDLTDADALALAVEAVAALSDEDARKVFEARFS